VAVTVKLAAGVEVVVAVVVAVRVKVAVGVRVGVAVAVRVVVAVCVLVVVLVGVAVEPPALRQEYITRAVPLALNSTQARCMVPSGAAPTATSSTYPDTLSVSTVPQMPPDQGRYATAPVCAHAT
jgi:hypothetical protein